MNQNLFTIALLIVVCFALGATEIFAQCGADGTQPCNSTPKKTTIKKTITPKKTPTKTTVPKPQTTTKKTQIIKTTKNNTNVLPLLAINLRLLSVDKTGVETEVAPFVAFTPNDRLRLSIKANQTGYLYVIRQTSPEADGEMIFPTPLVNGGSNFVKPNLEYVLPRNCSRESFSIPRDCALQLFPFEDTPQEYFTLIFTRDSLVDLPNDIKNRRVSLANLMSAGKIGAKTMIDLIENSGQDLVSQQGDTPYSIRIINLNPKNNEEIIETFVLSKMKK